MKPHSSPQAIVPSGKSQKRLKHNCLWFMSLQTGVTLIAIADILCLIFLIAFIVITRIKDFDSNDHKRLEFFLFLITTDGIVLILFICKCYYGVKFLVYSCIPSATSRTKKRRATVRSNRDDSVEVEAE